MGLTSHFSNDYNAFSSYRVSFYLILSLTKMYLMKSLKIMVLGLGLPYNQVYLVCALFFENSVDRVCGLSYNGVTKFVCRVSRIFSV